ncbi:MAG: pyridoxal phosphate-dependent aminotransferase [Ignavibacteriaceae bacterium]
MKNNKNNQPDINLNLNVRGIPQSATLAINERSEQLKREGKKVYKLGLGQSPFPVPQPVVDALKINAYQKDYLAVKGLYPLREAIAEYYSRVQGLTFSSDDVLIGPGSKELMFLLQFVYYGDLVIPTPSWVSYAPQAQIIGRHVRWIPTRRVDKWKLTPEELIAHCKDDPVRPRIVILNYPSNPSSVTYSFEELKKIAAVAKKYKIILLSDEIYGELHHEGKHVSIARFYPEGTVISSGLSKWCGAGGWRLGTFVFPPNLRWLLNSMAAVASETFTATSAPIQYAAISAFKGGPKIQTYLEHSRNILKVLGNYVTDKLIKSGVNVSYPEGGFYVFPDFTSFKDKFNAIGINSGKKLCEKLLDETGVAILPGVVFGRPENELTARIAYVDFDGTKVINTAEKLKKGKEIDEGFLKTYCGNTVKAIDLLCDWLKQ